MSSYLVTNAMALSSGAAGWLPHTDMGMPLYRAAQLLGAGSYVPDRSMTMSLAQFQQLDLVWAPVQVDHKSMVRSLRPAPSQPLVHALIEDGGSYVPDRSIVP